MQDENRIYRLGNVGALSGSLLRNGVDLTVHDLDHLCCGKGCAVIEGGSPAQMMMVACDAVICLPSPAASAAVVEQMPPEVGAGKIWLEMSTTDAARSTLGGTCAQVRRWIVRFRADVSADTGNISIYAGCDATFDRKGLC
jgi:3-hydroxyisobutyrate dehydrogenase